MVYGQPSYMQAALAWAVCVPMKTSRFPFAALVLSLCCAALVQGCGAGLDGSASADDLNSQSHRHCKSDANCYNHYVCQAGFCQKPTHHFCSSDSECPAGEVCTGGNCTTPPPPPPPPPACSSNTDCSNGQVCSNGSCQACTGDGQCASGLVCTNGACGTPPPPPPPPPPAGGCASEHDCANGGLCESGQCVASACNQRAPGKTGIRATVLITQYQGVIHGRNGDHEIAFGTLSSVDWIFDPATMDTGSVQLAMNIHSSTDPTGLPQEIPVAVGSTIEVEGEYISAATASGGKAVIHFTHSTCGYVTIDGSTYQ